MAITAWSAKVLKESDLLVRERTNFRAPNQNDSNRAALAEQRSGELRSNIQLDGMLNVRVVFFALGRNVVDVDCLPVENGPSDCRSRA